MRRHCIPDCSARALRRWGLGLLLLLAPMLAGAEAFLFSALAEPGDPAAAIKRVPLLEQAQRPWRLCVILPNPRDSYWSLVRYGLEAQAAKLALELTLIEASGYQALQQQVSLIDKRCVAGGHDALILAAVDYSGLNAAVRRARDAGLVVIDLINGISTPEVSARVAVNYGDLAHDLGRYMAARPGGGRVIWSPGPEGSVWSHDASAGFRRALAGTGLTLTHSYYAAPFIRDQRRQLLAIAKRYEFDRVAGTAVTAEAAVSIRSQLGAEVEIYSYYYSPKIHRLIRCGQIQAAVYEYPALQGRVAIDQAVRILEQRPFDFQLSTARLLVTRDNLDRLLEPDQMPAALIESLRERGCEG